MTCGTADDRSTSNGASDGAMMQRRDASRRAHGNADLDRLAGRRGVRRVRDDRQLRGEREDADHQSFPPGGGSTLVLLLLLRLHVTLFARRAAEQLLGLLLPESALRLRLLGPAATCSRRRPRHRLRRRLLSSFAAPARSSTSRRGRPAACRIAFL